ncbi:Ubiquitin carboxyl-terminal hydrolase 33 [Symbiodinium microadriaticum]|uniref:Ubiquitin carboxyl-terminal hydrolase 33 n=1 Tax=Symbiodinium microadriaticum TaxID=2951 RepID=A0A1Q9DW30_SYMMI|nr:Ubiquitin carboxyl-terminal hydrolase 33 [Symbiodinium microadriaticum]
MFGSTNTTLPQHLISTCQRFAAVEWTLPEMFRFVCLIFGLQALAFSFAIAETSEAHEGSSEALNSDDECREEVHVLAVAEMEMPVLVSSALQIESFVRNRCFQLANDKLDQSAPYHSPEDVLRAVQQLNPTFQGYSQQGSQEFLRCVLDNIHEELRRKVPDEAYGSQEGSSENGPSDAVASRLLRESLRQLAEEEQSSSQLHDRDFAQLMAEASS